jgi:hypothetical protein
MRDLGLLMNRLFLCLLILILQLTSCSSGNSGSPSLAGPSGPASSSTEAVIGDNGVINGQELSCAGADCAVDIDWTE